MVWWYVPTPYQQQCCPTDPTDILDQQPEVNALCLRHRTNFQLLVTHRCPSHPIPAKPSQAKYPTDAHPSSHTTAGLPALALLRTFTPATYQPPCTRNKPVLIVFQHRNNGVRQCAHTPTGPEYTWRSRQTVTPTSAPHIPSTPWHTLSYHSYCTCNAYRELKCQLIAEPEA